MKKWLELADGIRTSNCIVQVARTYIIYDRRVFIETVERERSTSSAQSIYIWSKTIASLMLISIGYEIMRDLSRIEQRQIKGKEFTILGPG